MGMNERVEIEIRKISGGPKAEASGRLHSDLPPQIAGRHLWIYLSMFRCARPGASRVDLDMENLLSIEGPCCYWCEEAYSDELVLMRCRAPAQEHKAARA